MSLFFTAGCRVRQTFYRMERRRHAAEPTAEEGPGSVFSVAQLLRSNRLKKPLLVIGRDAGAWSERVTRPLEESGIPYVLWDDLPYHPTAEDGESIRLAWIREVCDCFIVLGGREVIDIVKAAAARAACRSQTIMNMVGSGKLHRKSLPPVVAIPTEAGSGAESLAWAVVTDGLGNRYVIEDTALVPPYAILDPELMEDVSRTETADGIIDGLCLAVEAYLSGYGDERSRRAAAEAAEGFFSFGEPCWNNGGTTVQRMGMMKASWLAGAAASRAGGGYARALSRSVMKVSDASFGEACAGILPAVMEKYGNTALDRLAGLAEASGVADEGSKAEKTAALIRRMRQLTFRIGLPDLAERVSPASFGEIADLAAAESNPRYACPIVCTAENLREILRRAYGAHE